MVEHDTLSSAATPLTAAMATSSTAPLASPAHRRPRPSSSKMLNSNSNGNGNDWQSTVSSIRTATTAPTQRTEDTSQVMSRATAASNSVNLGGNGSPRFHHRTVRGSSTSTSSHMPSQHSQQPRRAYDRMKSNASNDSERASGDNSFRTSASSARRMHTSGVDFYDTGYTKEECNAEEPPITKFQHKDEALASFLQRTQEYGTLHALKDQILFRDVNTVDNVDNVNSVNSKQSSAVVDSEAPTSTPSVQQQPQQPHPQPQKQQNIASSSASQNTSDADLLPGVLVWGLSGTGKSKLVQTFCKDVQDQTNTNQVYLLQGQYDENTSVNVSSASTMRSTATRHRTKKHQQSDPFSAIIQAFTDFAHQLGKDEVDLERIRRVVRETMGESTAVGSAYGGSQQQRGGSTVRSASPSRRECDANTTVGSTTSATDMMDPLHHHRNQQQQSQSQSQSHNNNNKHIPQQEDSEYEDTLTALEDYHYDREIVSALTSLVPSLSIIFSNRAGGSSMADNSSLRSGSIRSSGTIVSNEQSFSHLSSPETANRRANKTMFGIESRSANAWNRLQYVFLQFVKAISTKERPIILFLDNLQWASSLSLELLASLLSDPELKHFLFIGVIREEHSASAMSTTSSLSQPRGVSHSRTATARNSNNDNEILPYTGAGSNNNSNDNLSADDSHTPIQQFLDRLDETGKPLEQLTMHNLSLAGTVQLVADIIERTQEDCESLTQQIYAKTKGNILFTMQALEELVRHHVLMYSRISFQWEWNIPSTNSLLSDRNASSNNPNNMILIQQRSTTLPISELPISDNVLKSITSKVKNLPQPLQKALAVASYIRSNFDVRILEYILRKETLYGSDTMGLLTTSPPSKSLSPSSQLNARGNVDTNTTPPLMQWLEEAVLEGLLLNPVGGTKYRFAHGRIHQAASSLVPFGEERDKLRARIGKCLFQLWKCDFDDMNDMDIVNQDGGGNNHNGDAAAATKRRQELQALQELVELEGLLFVAADHLNCAPSRDHLFSLTVNLDVGEKALQMAAIAPASTYLHRAGMYFRKLRAPWQDHYDMCLRLCRARCAVELSLGHIGMGREIGQELFENAQSLDDKLPSYLAIMQALGRQDQHMDSRSMARSVAQLMGIFPKRKWSLMFHIARDLRYLKRYLRRHTIEEIVMHKPILNNERIEMEFKIMSEFAIRSFLTKGIVEWLVATCKLLRGSIIHGPVAEAAGLWPALGLFFLFNGDLELGVKCADIAHGLMSRLHDNSCAGWVYFLTTNYIYAFTYPVSDIIRNFQKGYIAGMEAGEFEIGFVNWHLCNITAFCTGYELGPLIKTFESAKRHSSIYRVESMSSISIEYLYLMRTLTGELPLDWEDVARVARIDISPDSFDPSDTYSMTSICNTRMILAIFFFKFEWAEAICEKFWVLTSHEKSHIAITQRSLQTGLIAAGRYRETKRRRYLKRLRQMIVTLKNVKKLKGAKVTHQSRILEAEELSLRKSKDIRGVQNAYDEAIKAAAEAGHLHEAALTAELAGEFFLRSKRNTYVQDYFVQALGFYEGWGAHSKANDLRQRHALYTASSKSDKLNMRASSHSMLIPNTVQDMSTSRRTTVDLISVFTPPQSMVGSSVSEKGSRMQGDTDQQQQQHKPRHLAQRHHQTQTQQPQQNMRHNHHQQHEMQQKHDEVDADDDDVSVLTGGS